MEEIIISAANMSKIVEDAFEECLFKEDEDKSNYVRVEGIMRVFGFHPERLEKQRELVTALLTELPKEFKEGYTFLNFGINKDGRQWSGDYDVFEKLITMAIGLDLMSFCFPRKMWGILPGGVPYVKIK